MANLLKWLLAKKQADYDAVQSKDTNALYFVEETGAIFKGSVPFGGSVIFYGAGKAITERPATGVLGKIYVDAATLAGYVHDGTAWKQVLYPVDQTVDANTANPVSSAAVKTYVDGKVGEGTSKLVKTVAWDETDKQLDITLVDDTVSNVSLTKLAASLTYDGGTGKITLLDSAGTNISEVNIPLDNFVKSGTYDDGSKEIVLTMQNASEVRIPASDLVDVYTGATSQSATVDVQSNAITVNVKVDGSQSLLTVGENGLKVVSDASKMNVIADATDHANEVLLTDANGQAILSGVKVGGATLAGTPNAVTLATEAAVKAITDSISADISNAVAKSDVVTTLNAASPSETKVTSESAVVNALSWGEVPAAPTTPETTQYTVTITQPENGTITVNDGETDHTTTFEVDENTSVTVTAQAEEGYEFTELKFGEETINSGDSKQVTAAVTVSGTVSASVGG